MAKTPLVTLLTDFGTDGPFAAAMKGVILQVCPRANIIDISHDIPAYDLLTGALVIFNSTDMIEIAINQGRAADYFKAKVGSPVTMVMG